MENLDKNKILERVAPAFCIKREAVDAVPYGNGHINDTIKLTCKEADGKETHYILQRMNRTVFGNTEELMENIRNITAFLRGKILERGGEPERETLNVVPTREGKSYYTDEDGSC